MAEVEALFPVGKTQWRKWSNSQRTAFNEAREAGVSYADAVAAANQTQAGKKPSLLDVVEDVAEAAATVSSVAPVVATAVRAVRGSKPKKGK